MASTSPEKAVVYLLEAYRKDPLDHVARFWLPVVLEQVVPLRTVSVSGYCATDTSPNGQVAAFKAASGSRVIVDLETSEVLLRMDGVPDAAHMAFSERSERVLVARGTHGTVWDVQAGVLIRTLELPERHFSFKFSFDGSRLLVNADTSAVVWDLETGEQVGTFPWDEFSSNVSLSADGARVLVPGSSGAEVHDLNTANLLAAFPVDESAEFDSKLGPGPQDAVPPQIGPDLWDTQSPEGILLVYIGPGRDAGLALWDIEKDRIAHKLLDREWAMLVRMASFVNRGRQVVAMSGTHVKVWDVKTGSLQRTLRGTSVSFNRDGDRAFTTWNRPSIPGDCGVEIWDITPPRLRRTWRTTDPHITDVQYIEEQDLLLLGHGTDRVEVVQDPEHLQQTPVALHVSRASANVWQGAPRARGTTDEIRGAYGQVVSVGQEHKLTVNAPYTGRELFVLDEPLCGGKVLISPDRRTLVTCGEVPKLWDVHTGQFLGELSQGEPIVRAAFSNRGNYLVTATSSGVVQLWDVQLEATPPEHIWHQVRHQLRWTLEDGQLVPKLTQ